MGDAPYLVLSTNLAKLMELNVLDLLQDLKKESIVQYSVVLGDPTDPHPELPLGEVGPLTLSRIHISYGCYQVKR